MKVPLKSKNAFMSKIVFIHYNAEMFHFNAPGNKPARLIVAFHFLLHTLALANLVPIKGEYGSS